MSELSADHREKIQKYIWHVATLGWNPLHADRWSHEDNQAMQPYGILMYADPNGKYQLYSLRERVSERELIDRITRLAPICPYCAKAVVLLSIQRLNDDHYPHTNPCGEISIP